MPLVSPQSDASNAVDSNQSAHQSDDAALGNRSSGSTDVDNSSASKHATAVPHPNTNSDIRYTQHAQRVLANMSRTERIGQLFMVPLERTQGAQSLTYEIQQQHVGAVLLTSGWTQGADDVKAQTQALQAMSGDKAQLLISTDQEGGQVQHVQGAGFDAMPTAIEQGRMTTRELRAQAALWGEQLNNAGINTNLAPVVDTVLTTDRKRNAPIGAWDRDFGLNPRDNGNHAAAFTLGMHDAHVLSSIKHFPGLGAVWGNTDYTAEGITDTVTTFQSTDPSQNQILGFTTAYEQSQPELLMMSLATYTQLDPDNPAALSPNIIAYARQTLHFTGVIISDSLSAAALAGISPSDVAVRFVQAGGDMLCIGQHSAVQPMITAVTRYDSENPQFASLVDQSALRILTMKAKAGLLPQ